MCGIAGFIGHSAAPDADRMAQAVNRMIGAISHRGPDDSGIWTDPIAGVALGHRRLSILDLSPEGHQPMHSVSSRYVIVYNGEIYNFREVKRDLATRGVNNYRGGSDTEVMLAAFEEWGLEESLKRFNGMFAFALWDTRERALHLGIDRFGEKPLYYGSCGGTFLFGSELKALRGFPGFCAEVDRNALGRYFRFGNVPGPSSIYTGISKIEPGTFRTLNSAGALGAPVSYWSARRAAEYGLLNPFKGTVETAVEELDVLLTSTVGSRMVADVPLGAFLSGGIDSSVVVALMQKCSSTPVKTFTIGFHEDAYNEAGYAAEVARHLGTDHTELYVSEADALRVVPLLPRLYDEPFADSSQIPTFLVSQLARRSVTVSLSGDGGDELFGGYTRYLWTEKVWRRMAWMPESGRRLVAAALNAVRPDEWDSLAFVLSRIPAFKQSHLGDKMQKLARLLEAKDAVGMYRRLISDWPEEPSIVIGVNVSELERDSITAMPPGMNLQQIMMLLDTETYLPGDILTKVDRAAMAVSLESRVPMLDHRVYEFAWSLPLSFKIREGKGKWILRQVLNRYVPEAVMDRPKKGFGVPLDRWLRGPLRAWAEELLDEARLKRDGYLHAGPVLQKWQEHLSGKRNWAPLLWDVLMFSTWLDGLEAAGGPSIPKSGVAYGR